MDGRGILESRPWDAAHLAAAVVTQEQGHLHIGMFHTRGVIHLAWENILRNDWPFVRSLWICPVAQEEQLRNAAQLCRKIWKQFETTKTFPYGLGLEASFDTDGHLLVQHTSPGLTCATLVVAAFRAVGIDLLKASTWPVRTIEDRAWLEYLRGRFPSLDFTRLQADVDAQRARVHPQEVMGACMRPPVEFAEAKRLGAEVIKALEDLDERVIAASLDASFE